MNVVDSSCWLEYANKSPIGYAVKSVVENAEELLVPALVLYEVFKKTLAVQGEEYAIEFLKQMRQGRLISCDETLCIEAVYVSRQYKLALADSIIYATTLHFDAVLWTSDKHFQGLLNVQYFDKKTLK
jgi:predicted nucleic acid-binding protein